MAEALLVLVGLGSIGALFIGVVRDHRQSCRKEQRQLRTQVVAAVHRQDFAESIRAIGGSGGRR